MLGEVKLNSERISSWRSLGRVESSAELTGVKMIWRFCSGDFSEEFISG